MADLDIAELRRHVNGGGGFPLPLLRALLDADEQLQAVTAERDKLRADLRSQLTAAFAKLRETLGSDIGTGGGLVEILDGIDQLRAKRDALLAAADGSRSAWDAYLASEDDDRIDEWVILSEAMHGMQSTIRNCKETNQ